MNRRTLLALRDEHSSASWAVWSDEFPESGCLEEHPDGFFEYVSQRRDELRPEVVLLSLNPSTVRPWNYRNFHSTDPAHRNDQFRCLVEGAGLEGAYMTDLVQRVVDATSANVEPTEADVRTLFEQLESLGRDRYHLICFHGKVFQTLESYFDAAVSTLPHDISWFSTDRGDWRLHCYRVWFHANWGANKDKLPALRNQLSFLESEIVGVSNESPTEYVD